MQIKPEHYIVEESMNAVYKAIQLEMDTTLFKKKYNLSGLFSENGGLDLYPKVVFASFKPNLGPVAKVNLSSVNISADGNRSKLTFQRINGLTYKVHVGFAVGFTLLVILIAVFYGLNSRKSFDFNILFFPMFGIFYVVLMEIFADIITHNTIKRIKKILTDNKIKFEKL